MAQEQGKKSSSAEEETQEAGAKDVQNKTLSDDVEDILEDIDEVLEENAEEFVNSYVQRVVNRGAKREVSLV